MKKAAETCRSCKKQLPEDASFFPFCSQRCKDADLYGWFSEKYRVASDTPPDEYLLENQRLAETEE